MEAAAHAVRPIPVQKQKGKSKSMDMKTFRTIVHNFGGVWLGYSGKVIFSQNGYRFDAVYRPHAPKKSEEDSHIQYLFGWSAHGKYAPPMLVGS